MGSEKVETPSMLAVASRIFVWAMLFAVIYVLRSFFLLIFLTFVFAYIQETCVDKLERWIRIRTLRVVLVALFLLSIIIGLGAFLVPKVKEQGEGFVEKFPTYIQTVDSELVRLRDNYPMLADLFPELKSMKTQVGSQDLPASTGIDFRDSVATHLLQEVLGSGGMSGETFGNALGTVRNLGSSLLTIGSAFLLSLLFSFLIVLDFPRLAAGVRELRRTRVKFIYDEVAGSIHHFGQVMGRALEAQFYIAILNTILTAIGIYILGFSEQIPFLSMVVFFCSFIPVAGVFISSVPICLVALQTAGLGLMLLSIGMITVVHMIEAYILNPRIYGHHMRLNPVIVLIILTIGGKMFHVWGLILGVPICTYIFGHAIRHSSPSSKN